MPSPLLYFSLDSWPILQGLQTFVFQERCLSSLLNFNLNSWYWLITGGVGRSNEDIYFHHIVSGP